MFDLHAPSLFLAASLTNLVAAILLLRQRNSLAGRDVLLPWAGFAAAYALGNAALVHAHGVYTLLGAPSRIEAPPPLVLLHLSATPAMTLLAFGLLWLAVRRISGRGMPPWAVLLAPAAWTLVVLVPALRPTIPGGRNRWGGMHQSIHTNNIIPDLSVIR